MRNLPTEIVAAIETAVKVNDGFLDSAFIHSLAKIYKTSPQAVVWNMKRYNKVKAGCDDRKAGGRPVAMDKDRAAEYVRILLTEAKCAGEKMKLDKVAEIVSQQFNAVVSPTWISRLMKQYEIEYKAPKEVGRGRGRNQAKAPQEASAGAEAESTSSTWVPQYPLPAGQYPSFREDLPQATGTSEPPLQSRAGFAPINSYAARTTSAGPTSVPEAFRSEAPSPGR